ncbi:hypothetical protein WKR98_18785 [Pigmentiphaga sp. YJ18]|nr:hypothetical protein [Pigmentiphaga sp. H8]
MGRLTVTAPGPSFGQLRGILKGKTNGAKLSIEDINAAIAEGAMKADGP